MMPTTSGIRFGASLGAWEPSDIADQLREMAAVVEAATVFPYPWNLPVPSPVLREVRSAARELDLTLLVHGPIWELYTASIFPHVRTLGVEMVKQAVDFAVEIDAVHITLHPGSKQWPDVWPDLEEQALTAQAESFSEIGEYAARAGILVGIENMLRGPGTFEGYVDGSEIDRVLGIVPNMGVTLDVGHLHVARMDPLSVLRRFGPSVNHMHLTDNGGDDDSHLPVGEGSIEWEPVCQALQEIGYEGFLEIERSLTDGGVLSSITKLTQAFAQETV